MHSIYATYSHLIAKRKSDSLYRSLYNNFSTDWVLDFTKNDYLDLSKSSHDDNVSAGNLASRVISNHEIYNKIEDFISNIKRTDRALVFPSGYQLNSSVIHCLLSCDVNNILVFCDEYVHESIVHGILYSKVRFVRYKNADLHDLERLLQNYQNDKRVKFVFTEYVFGMDGTVVDLKYLFYLKKIYNLFVYIDEAHAIGVCDDLGYAVVNNDNYDFDVIMGNFSKSLAGQGGYLACNEILYDYIINFCKGFIYSTGLSPLLTLNALKNLQKISDLNIERHKLNDIGQYLKMHLHECGFDIVGDANSSNIVRCNHIVPIFFHKEYEVLDIQNKLRSCGINVSAIRYPTVPIDKPRLRISLNSGHTKKDVDFFISTLKSI